MEASGKKTATIEMDSARKTMVSRGQKCEVRNKDMINRLPDEVIVIILSKLHLKEAGRSSVLSKRWRLLWTYLTDLDFDDYKKLYFLDKTNDGWIKVKKYVNWVHKMLLLYEGRTPQLNSIKIHFEIGNNFSSYVTKWFDFAMTTKPVKHLYLNLGSYISITLANACCLQPISNFPINENLQSLSLVCVDLADQLIDSILAQCPNLERLSLSYCNRFTRLKLVPSSSKLKHLFLQHCFHASDIEIYAPNLTCFAYFGNPSHYVNFLHVPNLTEVAFGGLFCTHLLENLHGSYQEYRIQCLDSLLSLSSQLHKVSLCVQIPVRYNSTALGAALRNLKQLELMVDCGYNCLLLTSFIEACPLLQAFKLKLTMSLLNYGGEMIRTETINPKHIHKKLKIVEYVGEIGSESSVELALCLTKQALFLETFIFECCLLDNDGQRCFFYDYWVTQRIHLSSYAARSLAHQIRAIKPVNIIINQEYVTC